MQGQRRSLDQVRDRIWFNHFSIRTAKDYVGWIRRFILFHNKRHAFEIVASELNARLFDRHRHSPRRILKAVARPLYWTLERIAPG